MAILKIKDKGVWKEIQAIKGDTGHDVYVGDKSKAPSEAKLIIEPVKGTATGTDIQVTDSANDRVSKLVLDGKSTQETRSGKNLFKPLNITNNGITTTYDKNGLGTIKGTITSSWANISANVIYSYPAGNYVLSIDEPKTFYVSIKGVYTDKETFEFAIPVGSKTRNVAFKKEVYNMYAYISGFEAGTTLDETIKIQLEKGSVATDYEPYGVMPSPDYPSEIENVKGKNLFKPTLATTTHNGITCTANEDGTYTLNGTATADAIFTIGADRNLIIGKTYKFSGCPNGGSNTTYRIGWNYYGYEYGNGLISKKTSEIRNVQITIFKGVTASNLIFKPMFTENTSSTYNDYVPYGNIQIVETGKNLADINSIKIGKNWVNITDPRRASILSIPIEPNTKYTLSGNINSNTHLTTLRVVTFEKLGDNFRTGVFAGAFTTPSNAHYLSIEILADTTITSDMLKNVWVQLEKGTQATDYEPYTEEVVNINLKGNELCSLPNGTKDELIVKDGRAKIIKRIGEVILDGSDDENWLFIDNNQRFKTASTFIPKLSNIKINKVENGNNLTHALSNYYTVSTQSNVKPGSNKMGFSQWSGVKFLYLPADYNTVDKFKAWLSTHNTTVQYELAEPYEIDLGEVSMLTTYEGTSNITNSEDTNMSIEYVTNKTNLYYQNNGNIIKMNEGS